MLDSSQILTAASIGVIILLFLALSVFLLLRGIYLKLNGESSSIFAGRPTFFILFVHCFSLLVIGAIIYSAQIEPRILSTNWYGYTSNSVNEKVRIAFLADIDWPLCRVKPEKIAADINQFSPDIVVLGGDIVTQEEFSVLLNAMKGIQCPLKFGVIGNSSSENDAKFYKDANIQVLDSRSATVEVKGTKVFILGIPWFGEDLESYKPFPKDSFKVFATHTPELIPAASSAGFDLYLGAHTHGGQVRFPFEPDLFVPGEIGKLYPCGDFEVGSMIAVISKGIGIAPGYNPRLRFMCPPEICLVEFASSK